MSNRRQIVVYRARLGDVDDPELYAAEPLYQFEKSELGQWVMTNAVPESVKWHTFIDPAAYGYQISIRAEFEGIALTEYFLRWA